MPESQQEEMLGSFLVLIIGNILNWADVPKGGGDPLFLTSPQAEAFAAEGISLLARYLPPEAAKVVTTAVAPHARKPQRDHQQALLRVGAFGGHLPTVGGRPGGPPGCCVFEPGRGMICVN
jgi:hypothetical protein